MIRGYFASIDWFTKEDFEGLQRFLSEEDLKAVFGFKQIEDQQRAILSFYGTNEILRLWGVDRHALKVGSHGKKYVELEDKHFSVSHSGQWVVHICSDQNVGVDIQEMRDRSYKILELDASVDKEKFYRIWTAKEAYVKYLGIGLQKELASFEVVSENTFLSEKSCAGVQSFVLDNYILSVCTKVHEKLEVESWAYSGTDRKEEVEQRLKDMKKMKVLEKKQAL